MSDERGLADAPPSVEYEHLTAGPIVEQILLFEFPFAVIEWHNVSLKYYTRHIHYIPLKLPVKEALFTI